jgi:hypothetical protein
MPSLTRGYQKGDHRGHLVGDVFFGRPLAANLVPMHPSLNLSSFKTFEKGVLDKTREKADAGHPPLVHLQITPDYGGHNDAGDDKSYRPQYIVAVAHILTLDEGGGVKQEPISSGRLENPESGSWKAKPLVLGEIGSAEELADQVQGLSGPQAVAIYQYMRNHPVRRQSDLEALAQVKGIEQTSVDLLLEKRRGRKLKFYTRS